MWPKWLKQPTTIHAIGVLAGWGAGLLAWKLSHGNGEAVSGAFVGAFSLVCALMNDATTGQPMSDEDKAVMRELIEAATSNHLKQELPKIVNDGLRDLVGAKPNV